MGSAGACRPWAAAFVAIWLWAPTACSQDPEGGAGSETSPTAPKGCGLREQPDGSCCPAGHYFEYSSGACVAVGPPVCADLVLASPGDCVPRWCADLATDGGKACEEGEPGCRLRARVCSSAELKDNLGCAAGQWPNPNGTGCAVAGQQVQAPADVPARTKPAALPVAQAPRWCPSGPDGAPAACGAGQQGCAVGELAEGGEGASCAAITGVAWSCPPGFVEDPSQPKESVGPGPCKPDPSDCGSEKFHGAPTDPSGVVYVEQGFEGGSDGSKDKPFATLTQALAAKPKTVMLAAGTYVGSLAFSAPVVLRGRCAALVRLQGSADGPTLHVQAVAAPGVVLQRLSVAGAGVAVSVAAGGVAKAERVHLRLGSSHGVAVTGAGSHFDAADMLVSAPDKGGGRGVFAFGGASVTLKRVRLSEATYAGLDVDGAATKVDAKELLIDHTRPDASGAGGLAVGAAGAARVDLSGALLTSSRWVGMLVDGAGTTVEARDLVVRETAGAADGGANGFGLAISGGASLDLRHAVVANNRDAAIFVLGVKSRVSGANVAIRHTGSSEKSGTGGHGLRVLGGGRAELQWSDFEENRAAGVYASQPATTAVLAHALVRSTRQSESGDASGRGIGVQIEAGAMVTLVDARLRANHDVGLFARGAGAQLEAQGLTIDATMPRESDSGGGRGLWAVEGAQVKLSGARLRANRSIALVATDPGTTLDAQGLVVDDTMEDAATGAGGYGVVLAKGAKGTLKDIAVWDNRIAGLSVTDPGTTATVDGLVVARTHGRPGAAGSGAGLMVGSQASLTARRVRLADSEGTNLIAIGAASLAAQDLIIEQGPGDVSGPSGGLGLTLYEGARMTLERARITGSRGHGVSVEGPGTELRASDVEVRNTTPRQQFPGIAIGVYGGGLLQLSGGRLTDQSSAGLEVSGAGARAEVAGLEVTQPAAGDDGLAADGRGVKASAGASVSLLGSVFSGNRGASVEVANAEVGLVGVDILETRPAKGFYGLGIMGTGANVSLLASRIVGARAGGVFANGGTLSVRESVIADTRFGRTPASPTDKPDDFADGVAVRGKGVASLERSVVAANARAGLLLSDTGAVEVQATVVTGGVFGVVSQSGAQPKLAGTLVHANSMANVVGGQGLSVPAAPTLDVGGPPSAPSEL